MNRYFGQITGAIIAFFILLFVYTKLAGPIPFTIHNINTAKENPFTVEGRGSASAAPDQATVSFGVTKNAETVENAQAQTNSAMKNIIDNIKDLDISNKNIKTTNYSVNPNYNFSENQRITGYTVTQNVEVKIEKIENTNRIIDAITAGGANLVGQIQFGFTDKAKQKLQEEARKEAFGNAKQKAENIAKVTGVRLGKIINVQELEEGGVSLIPFLERSAEEDKLVANTNITPGENSVKLTLILTYEIN